MKRILTALFLTVTVCICLASPFSASQENSYAEYFGEERALLNSHPITVNYSYLYPIIDKDGNICMLTYKSQTETGSELLFYGNYSSVFCDGEFLYAIENKNTVYKLNMVSKEKVLLYSSDTDLVKVYGYGDVVFFDSEENIYRLHPVSGTLDLYPKPDGLEDWRPMTNTVIEFIRPCGFFEACVKAFAQTEDRKALLDIIKAEYESYYGKAFPSEYEGALLNENIDLMDYLYDTLCVSTYETVYFNTNENRFSYGYVLPKHISEMLDKAYAEEELLLEQRMNGEIPQTSDSALTYTYLALISLTVACAVLMGEKGRFNEQSLRASRRRDGPP